MSQYALNEKNKVSDLKEALQECKKAAREGYAIANDNLNETEKAIKRASANLSNLLKSLDNGSARTPDVVEQLKSQLSHVVSESESLQQSSVQDLEARKRHLDHFSITLFGRTMVGKSTLMEILTRGNGASIGTGSQRTTRGVRTYSWNELEVTDVPGVAAFEGAEDEELAFKAAKQADLVLFLITDDAPQPAEAECLANVRRLGKPVLGICNVKVGLDDEDDLKLFLRNPAKPFDRKRIDQICSQFNLFADQYLPGKQVQFVAAHLRSQYLAQQNEYAKYQGKLLEVSRFSEIENRIVQEVTSRATFLKMKSFIDGAVVPMMNLTESLLEFSEQNSSSGRVLIGKRRRLQDWSEEFKTLGAERFNTQISELMEMLRLEVEPFSEDHYENNSADKSWYRVRESKGIEKKIDKLRKTLLDECQNELSETARQLKSELSIVTDLSSGRHIKMDSISDHKKIFTWVKVFVSGGLSVAAVIFGGAPLFASAFVVGNLGWFGDMLFDDREKKARKARETLSRCLYDDISKMEKKLRKDTSAWFHGELLNKQVYVVLGDLRAVTGGVFGLADTQRDLAWTLSIRQKDLGKILINKVLEQLDSAYLGEDIVDVARVPGFGTMLLILPNAAFPNDVLAKMEKLLDEKIYFVTDGENQLSILSKAIGKNCEIRKIGIEEKIRVAHVKFNIPPDERTKSRVRLAQQLTGLHILMSLN